MSSMDKHAFLGSTLLVSGCCIGAGMLGLPLAMVPYGFIPSLLPLLFAWVYMNISGLILLEGYIRHEKSSNMMGLIEMALGKGGKVICFILFSLLFYSILTAYLNGTSIIIHDLVSKSFSIPFSIIVTLNSLFLFLGILYGTKEVDILNRIFLFAMGLAYVGLVGMGVYNIDIGKLTSFHMSTGVVFTISVFVVSFGFQNLIPTLLAYLKKDVKKTAFSFVLGSLITFFVYLIWNFVILGLISSENALQNTSSEEFITRLFTNAPILISILISCFSFFSIITSQLTISMSFANFLADKSESKKNRPLYVFLVLFPPIIFSLGFPNVFLSILRYASGTCAILLFGVLPTLALWRIRKRGSIKNTILPGGKTALLLYLAISIALIAIQVVV